MTEQANPKEIVDFWVNEVGREGWYRQDDALDATVRARFGAAWEAARAGAYEDWRCQPGKCLALLILLDQFPRNMFRGGADSFATDARARHVAKLAIDKGHDLATEEQAREFFYLPLMHSEQPADQDRAVRLYAARMEKLRDSCVLHARAHREIIRRFGRFPFRNAALGRKTTPEEAAFIEAGGYGAVLEKLAA